MSEANQHATSHYHYIILGAGPAGLQLGYFTERAGREYLILEAGDGAGTFFKKFPRHRTLISINKLYTGYDDPEINMRWDWNSLLSEDYAPLLKDYSDEFFPGADELCRYLQDYADEYSLNIAYSSRIARVSKEDNLFTLETSDGRRYSCRVLIVATGLAPFVPPIEGIETTEQYDEMPTDPSAFANQRVLIIGKGNSAFETADNIAATAALIHLASPTSLKHAWKTHYPGHLRAVNNNILDTYRLKLQNALLDANVDRIVRTDDGKYVVSFSYSHASGEREDLVYDRVLCCAGWRFDSSIFDDSCRPRLTFDGRLPELRSDWQSTNVRDLYFAGPLMQPRDYKKSATAFIHGFRYNVRTLHRILEGREHGNPLPHRTMPATAESISDEIVARINRTSALWQQFGYLCDLVVVDERTKEARYYEELPVDYVHDGELGDNSHYYKITLEYGHEGDDEDPFANVRVERTDSDRAAQSKFLHPVVRRFSGTKLLYEHHIIEDLEAEWLEEEHTGPLLRFLREQLPAGEHSAGGVGAGRGGSRVDVSP